MSTYGAILAPASLHPGHSCTSIYISNEVSSVCKLDVKACFRFEWVRCRTSEPLITVAHLQTKRQHHCKEERCMYLHEGFFAMQLSLMQKQGLRLALMWPSVLVSSRHSALSQKRMQTDQQRKQNVREHLRRSVLLPLILVPWFRCDRLFEHIVNFARLCRACSSF